MSGRLCFFLNVFIFVSSHVAISVNVRAETKLGKRRTYSGRINMFLRSSLRFPNYFPKTFSKLFQTLWKKRLWKKSLEKNGSAPCRPSSFRNFGDASHCRYDRLRLRRRLNVCLWLHWTLFCRCRLCLRHISFIAVNLKAQSIYFQVDKFFLNC
jgi:hypothetical protein